MAQFAPLPRHLREALERIEPSRDGDRLYLPCEVTLRDGRVLSNVYIVPEGPYVQFFDAYSEQDRAKKWVKVEEIAAVRESPNRLPARFANELYRSGESGMGYTIFTVVFADGSRQAFGTGNAVDFIHYPEGAGPLDVAKVLPHEGRQDPAIAKAPEALWCFYAEDAQGPTAV